MKNCSPIKDLEKAKQSIKICTLNINKLKNSLLETITKLNTIQSQISLNSKLVAPDELSNLRRQENSLIFYTNQKKSLLLEFENELRLAEDKLKTFDNK